MCCTCCKMSAVLLSGSRITIWIHTGSRQREENIKKAEEEKLSECLRHWKALKTVIHEENVWQTRFLGDHTYKQTKRKFHTDFKFHFEVHKGCSRCVMVSQYRSIWSTQVDVLVPSSIIQRLCLSCLALSYCTLFWQQRTWDPVRQHCLDEVHGVKQGDTYPPCTYETHCRDYCAKRVFLNNVIWKKIFNFNFTVTEKCSPQLLSLATRGSLTLNMYT